MAIAQETFEQLRTAGLSEIDPEIAELLGKELDRQRDDALDSFERRTREVEATLRDRLQEIAVEAETERSVLDARLHDLARRVEELAAKG